MLRLLNQQDRDCCAIIAGSLYFVPYLLFKLAKGQIKIVAIISQQSVPSAGANNLPMSTHFVKVSVRVFSLYKTWHEECLTISSKKRPVCGSLPTYCNQTGCVVVAGGC